MNKTSLLLVCSFLCLGCIISSEKSWAQNAQSKNIEYTIDNCVVPFNKNKIKPTKSGYAFWFLTKEFSKSGLNVKLSYVDKTSSATHPPHQHPNDECFFILEGTAIVTIGDKEIRVKPSTCIYCPGGVLHGIRKTGKKPIKYLVINN